MIKFKILLLVVAFAGLAASLLVQRQTQVKLHENDETLRRQKVRLTELTAENERLAKLFARSFASPSDNGTGNLAKLRGEAAALRTQAQELAKELEQKRQTTAPADVLRGPSFVRQHNRVRMDMAQPGKRADARNLVRELLGHAKAHQGQFPSSFETKIQNMNARKVLTGTNDFEIVFQGSLNDLTNISLRGVAVIREPIPWLTQSGTWARVYGMADGAVIFVEPDDNFQSWEAEHFVPRPAKR